MINRCAKAGESSKHLWYHDDDITPGRFQQPHMMEVVSYARLVCLGRRAVANLEPRIRELAHTLLDQRSGSDTLDLVGDFSVPLPLMVIAELLGAPAADWPQFKRWSDVIVALSDTIGGGAAATEAVNAFRGVYGKMSAYLAELVDRRRVAPTDDVLSRLVEAEVDGERLSEDELLGFFQLLLLAGHETTTNLIGNAFLCLSQHPAQQARLRAEPNLLPAASRRCCATARRCRPCSVPHGMR